MAEKEYIERDVAIDEVLMGDIDKDYPRMDIAARLHDIPAADVREVVYCKDCHHRDPEDHKCDCGQLERAGCVFPVDDDYFCAYGER